MVVGAARRVKNALPLILFVPALLWGAIAGVGLVATAGHEPSWNPVDRRQSTVSTSDTCRACHPQQFESWHVTYHRTMTQAVGKGAVVAAPFAGEVLESQGFRATMTGGPKAPHIRVERLAGEDGPAQTLLDVDVALTVGSHRYQQYVGAIDRGGGPEEYWRLPVAWHIGESRWIHMNTAFVEPEGLYGDEDVFMRHLSRWNDNCILCHNTEPKPGLRGDGTFASQVGEVGIACEACHGPASAHVARHRNPFRRLLARGEADGSIAQPKRLDPGRESSVCGRCHGQRIGRDIAEVMRRGDGFIPGQQLAAVSRPIFADSQLQGMPEDLFAERFWPDQTPRLSAYEYQGLLQSPCYNGGEPGGLGCNHCHDMHNGEPNMQVRSGRAGAGACTSCHEVAKLGGANNPGGHGGHGDAIDCQGCHMPRVTYGLLTGMISHRIQSPDPAQYIGRDDQPDACTQCHVDRSRQWAAQSMHALGLAGSSGPREPAPEEAWGSRVLLDIYGGDPLQRILAAHALARPEVPVLAEQTMAWLVSLLEDEYPAVRWVAWQQLRTLADRTEAAVAQPLKTQLQAYDPHGDASLRLEVVDAIRQLLGPDPIAAHPERREALQARQERAILQIGE